MIRQGKDQEEAKWSRQIQGPDVALLRKLLADTDEEVRRIAVRKLDELATPLEPGVYDALTRDPAVTVRSELLNLWPLPTELRSALLATLARDSSPNVASRVDNVLSNVQGEEFTLDPGPYLPAIETRWKELEPELRRTLTINLVRSSSGLRTLAGLLLASGDPAAVQELNRYASAADLLRLPDEHLARVLMTSDRAREGPWDNLWQAIQESEPRRTAAMRLLLANEQASRPVRLQAAVLASDGTQTYRDGLLAFLALPMWKQQPIAEKERKQMRWAAERLGKDERCAMALIVVRDAKLDFDVATTFVGGNYPLDAAKSEELTKAVLERWFRPEVPENAPVWRALEHLGSLADPAWHPVLERALLDPAYAYQALRSVAAKRDASFLPLVARGLRAEWVPLAERDDVQVEAAQALASFNDPAAAQYLIEGLRSPYEEVRDQCRMGLERLEEYETHARAWKDRGRAAPTKESALAELVTMLDEKDPAIRRQAALGIATLGAIELIPQLIRLTKDADASVSQAAQKALDRLNEARPADTQEGG